MNAPDLWVFAYGSLMWSPGFTHLEARSALLRGYHRAMCILSTHYRGCHAAPGLVLGLDRGGSCRGRAFRVDAADSAAVIAYLHEREMLTNAYDPRYLPVHIDDGRRVKAYGFVVRHDHPQYCGRLTPEESARLIRQGHGSRGPCRDYLANTIRHLEELGIREGPLHRLLALVDQGEGGGGHA